MTSHENLILTANLAEKNWDADLFVIFENLNKQTIVSQM